MKKGLLTSFLVLCGLVALFACTTPLPKYKLTLNTNDDTMGTVSGAGEYEENASVTVTASINQNYQFVGWFEGTSLKSKLQDYSFKMPGNDYTLEARFQAEPSEETYTVTFNSNEGTDVNNITDVKENEKIKEPASPTKEGHTFSGWYKESTLSNKWDFNVDVVMDNITLYAKWDINKYKVSFNSNEGSAVTEYKDIPWNTKIDSPSNPSKEGHTFNGWYKESTLSNKWDFNVDVVKSNITLYAKWDINKYKVSFDSVDGSAVTEYKDVPWNTKITEPSNPTKDNHDFAGWYKDIGYQNKWDFSRDVVTKDTVLYAKWDIASFDIDFDSMGGSLVSSISADYNSLISSPQDPTKDGFTFAGWYKSEDNGVTLGDEWHFDVDVVSEAMTLYAKWNPIVLNVSFETNCDQTIDAYTDVKWNSKIDSPDISHLEKNGYYFDFWSKDDVDEEIWLFDEDVVKDDITLYAVWKKESYKVYFDENSADPTITNMPNEDLVEYEGLITRPSDPVSEIAEFAGWYKDAEFNDAWDFSTDVVTESVTLYAKWDMPNNFIVLKTNILQFQGFNY